MTAVTLTSQRTPTAPLHAGDAPDAALADDLSQLQLRHAGVHDVSQDDRTSLASTAVQGVHTIVVPLDGSRFSRAALEPAEALAARLDAEIVVVTVASPARVPGVDGDLARQLGQTDAQLLLGEVIAGVRRSGLRARSIVVTGCDGCPPAEAILLAAADVRASLIVMATHGRTGIRRAVLGSVADAVARESPVPVLLVRPPSGGGRGVGALRWLGSSSTVVEGSRSGHGIAAIRLLVALDGSRESETVLPSVAALVLALRAEVNLVHVLTHVATRFGDEATLGLADRAAYLHHAALQLQEAGVPATAIRTAVRYGPVAATLLDQAAREQASILAISSRGLAGLDRLVHGSVASEVVANSTLPVLARRTSKD
jgi:nucleotide-binding universal stress UspA family protein